MTEVWQDEKEPHYDVKYIPTVIRVGLTARSNVLETFRLEAEGVCRCPSERPFAEIPFNTESALEDHDGEV